MPQKRPQKASGVLLMHHNDPVAQTDLARCPACHWIGELDECDVVGASDSGVFCPACATEFDSVTGVEINEAEET